MALKQPTVKTPKRKIGDKGLDPTLFDPSELSPSKRSMNSALCDSKPNVDPLVCNICKLSLANPNQMQQHMIVVHKMKTLVKEPAKKGQKEQAAKRLDHPCLFCSEAFPSKTKLKAHRKDNHPKSKPIPIPNESAIRPPAPPGPPGPPRLSKPAPSISAPVRPAVKLHHEVKDEVAPEEFYCDECGLDYPNKQKLQHHMVTVHDEDITPSPITSVKKANMKRRDEESDESDEMEADLPEYIPGGFLHNEVGLEYNRNLSNQKKVSKMNPTHVKHLREKSSFNSEPVSNRDQYEHKADNEDDAEELNEFIQMDYGDIGIGEIYMDGYDNIAEEVVDSEKDDVEELSDGIACLVSRSSTSSWGRDKNYKLLNEDVSDVDEDDNEEEEEEEEVEEVDEFSSDEDEIILDSQPDNPREPEEVTLDEDSDGEDEIIVEKERNKQYEMELKNIEQYENFLSRTDVILNLVMNEEAKLKIIQDNSWFAKPRNWKPASTWESWNASVKQICAHYKVRDIPVDTKYKFPNYR